MAWAQQSNKATKDKATMTTKQLTKAQAKATAREAKDKEMLETINSTIDSAFDETTGRATTETRPTGERYTLMASLFGSILHDLALNLNWSGFKEAMIALKANKGFAYFGNPYNDKLINCLIDGYKAKLGKKDKIAKLNKEMSETLADNKIDPLEKIERMTTIQEKIAAISS